MPSKADKYKKTIPQDVDFAKIERKCDTLP